MLKNYFNIAWRNLSTHKRFSAINIFGLALGTACCLYILLYVRDEYSYDAHHAGGERTYRITSTLGTGDGVRAMATCSPPIPGVMKREFPEVEEVTRFVSMFGSAQQLFRYGEKVFYETDGLYADSSFFHMFSYHFVYGSPEHALAAPMNIVLTRETALKFFGEGDPVGKVLEMETGEGRRNFTVTGVIDHSLGKSHIKAHYFVSMDSGGIGSYAMTNDEWSGNNFTNAYIRLRPNAALSSVEAKLPDFLEQHAGEQMRRRNLMKKLGLQALSSIHTTTGFDVEPTKPASQTLLSILMGIAGLIQLIACINFMNLSTARAARRAREIGIRKVVGAARGALIGQFLSESLVISFLAMCVALPLVMLMLPYLNEMTGVILSGSFVAEGQVWLGLLLLSTLTGLVAGSYPALYLSGFQPIKILKNNNLFSGSKHKPGIQLRQVLVVFQFVLAIALIMSVVVIRSQLMYIRQMDLGFKPGQKIVIPFRTAEAMQHSRSYRDAVQQLPEVQEVSRANNYPSQFIFNDQNFYRQGSDMNASRNIQFMQTDASFRKSLDISLLAGRDFAPGDSADRVMLNEAALDALGIPVAEAVGQHLFSDRESGRMEVEIVGVMKNFHFHSLYSEVSPFMIWYSDSDFHSQLILKAEARDYTKLLAQLESAWKTEVPSVPFEYTFIDAEVQKLYEADRRLSAIINTFTFLTILISCLGLLGLAMFTAERRTREIGIRKVLGASVTSLVGLLSKDFLLLVLVALLLAAPLAAWAMSRWLESFAYRVQLQWWMFVLAGAAALLLAFLTISLQAVRAAIANPVKSLKIE
ncbi:MAG: FtsX-like permease family protein [Bacteroidetes bacterium]|nr:MAG: FtsX-like permease family protein [Bacteroidota bacterium]